MVQAGVHEPRRSPQSRTCDRLRLSSLAPPLPVVRLLVIQDVVQSVRYVGAWLGEHPGWEHKESDAEQQQCTSHMLTTAAFLRSLLAARRADNAPQAQHL